MTTGRSRKFKDTMKKQIGPAAYHVAACTMLTIGCLAIYATDLGSQVQQRMFGSRRVDVVTLSGNDGAKGFGKKAREARASLQT